MRHANSDGYLKGWKPSKIKQSPILSHNVAIFISKNAVNNVLFLVETNENLERECQVFLA
jgi:hypothetical protein